MVLRLTLELVEMVWLKVGIWVMSYVYKSPDKDRNTKVCVKSIVIFISYLSKKKKIMLYVNALLKNSPSCPPLN